MEAQSRQAEPEDPAVLALLVAEYPHGRVPSELRRRQIVAVATDLFIGRGFGSASMDELARRVGVSKPVVYSLVGSKEDLFHEIVTAEAARLAARVQSAVDGELDVALRLRAGILAFFQFISERRAAWRSLMASSDAPVTAEIARARRFQADVVAALLRRGAAETEIEFEPETISAVALAINGAVEALALWWHDHPEVPADALAALATDLVAPGLSLLAASGPSRHLLKAGVNNG